MGRTQWEYTNLIFNDADLFIDYRRLPGMLNVAGEGEWELVQIIPGKRNDYLAIFKRPKWHINQNS